MLEVDEAHQRDALNCIHSDSELVQMNWEDVQGCK